MEKQRPKAEPALRVKHSRYGYPVPRITPCATSCIKRVTPTSRSRLINVCEEHTSTASSFRLDRPERPTLVRKRSPRYQRIRFLLPSSLLPLLLCTESTKRRSKTLCRSRQRVLGGGEQLTGANVQFMHLDVTSIRNQPMSLKTRYKRTETGVSFKLHAN